MHTKTFTTLAACAAFSGSAHAAITDIEIGGLEVIGVDVLSHQIDIVVAYQLTNVGDTTVDLRGPDTDSNDDDAAVQTYLATSPDLSGAVAASGGGVLFNPVVLRPGEIYEGVYRANTAQLADPLDLGDFRWLAIGVTAIDDDVNPDNDRAVVAIPDIPSPGTAFPLLAVMAIGNTPRRRR